MELRVDLESWEGSERGNSEGEGCFRGKGWEVFGWRRQGLDLDSLWKPFWEKSKGWVEERGGIQKIEARDRSSPREKRKEMNDRREPRGGIFLWEGGEF